MLPAAASLASSVVFIATSRLTVFRGRLFVLLFDDAMISMRYARALASGYGLAWNIRGDRVEGYSNFLWTLWMAAVHAVGLEGSAAAAVVLATGIAIQLGILLVTWRLVSAVAPEARWARPVALWLVGLSFPLLHWNLVGLEVGFVALLLVSAALAALRGVASDSVRGVLLCGFLLALAALTRPDALVGVGVVLAWIGFALPRGRRRWALAPALIVVATVALHTLFRVAYYGDPLPATYYLKVGGTPLGIRLARGSDWAWRVVRTTIWPVVALAAVGFLSRRVLRLPAALLAAGFGAQVAYSIWAGGDAWEVASLPNRYVTTGLPFALVLAAIGIDRLVAGPPLPRPKLVWVVGIVTAELTLLPIASIVAAQMPGRWARLLALLVVIGTATSLLARGARTGRGAATAAGLLTGALVVLTTAQALQDTAMSHFDTGDRLLIATAASITDGTDEKAVVAADWAGVVPYLTWPRPAVDLLGKSDRHIAKMRPVTREFLPGHTKWDTAWSVRTYNPDVVVGFGQARIDETYLAAHGYRQVCVHGGSPWVRQGSRHVDVRRMAESLRRSGYCPDG